MNDLLYDVVIEVEGPNGCYTIDHVNISYNDVYLIGTVCNLVKDAGVHQQLCVKTSGIEEDLRYISISDNDQWTFID